MSTQNVHTEGLSLASFRRGCGSCRTRRPFGQRPKRRYILIVCEGEATEPAYFGAQVFLPDAIYLGPKIEEADEVLLVQTINNMKQTLGYELPIYRMVSNWGQRYYILEAEEYKA